MRRLLVNAEFEEFYSVESVLSNGTLYEGKEKAWERLRRKRKISKEKLKPIGMIGRNGRPPLCPLGGSGNKKSGVDSGTMQLPHIQSAKPTRMKRHYTIHHVRGHHLTLEDRQTIERIYNWNLRESPGCRKSQGCLADSLGIPRSTFSREIKRGRVTRPNIGYLHRGGSGEHSFWDYSAAKAQNSVDDGMINKGCAMKMTTSLAARLRQLIKDERRSPFNAVVIIGKEGGHSCVPCPRTIYNHINRGDIGITVDDTPYRRHHKKRFVKPRQALNHPEHVSIEERPAKISQRSEFGHWEMDTVVSGAHGKGGLLVLCERKTRYSLLVKINAISSSEVAKGLKKLITTGAMKNVRSITTDNGPEFIDSNLLLKAMKASSHVLNLYYTHAYTAWEKGSVENMNRIIRRWYKKGTDFRGVSPAKVLELQNFINSIPRLVTLGGKTAHESFSLAA